MRVFISSTSEDLGPYRSAAEAVVLDLGWQPDGMEHFGAEGSLGIVEACAERVKQADLVLAIIAWRRGGVPGPKRGGDGKTSYTKWEIDAAFRLKKPVLVLMASDTWPGKLWEDDAAARAWVKSFRGDLDRMAEIFESERVEEGAKEPLPVFRAKVRQELLRHQEKVLREQRRDGEEAPPEPASAVSEPSLRTWLAPEWPERPYPLLLPYSHPVLFAGRDRELAELRRLVLLPQPILCLHAASGAGKSSLLAAGLVPVLRAEGRPVAFERRPADPGLAGRLAGDLLEPGDDGLDLDDEKPDTFVEHLLTAERLAGAPSLLVLDQFEDLMRPDAGGARARLGLLLAASVQRQPGREGPPCRWLLAYREDFHGKVSKWLRDVLADARALELPAAENLPHDLSDADRCHAWPLPPLGTPPPGADRIEEAARAFQRAIATPLEVAADRYRWRFDPGAAERLARAFAEARAAQPDAPLVPELQVVLAHLLQEAGEPATDSAKMIQVPEQLEAVIGRALENHLRRALDAAFTGQSASVARQGRTRVLLALRELADAEGKRGESLSAADLATAIGEGGGEVLELLARRDTRIIVPLELPEGLHYTLSHDRLADVVARMVEQEGRRGALDVDPELLRLRHYVRILTELYRTGESTQATRLETGDFGAIQANADVLLWDQNRQRWWQACQERHQEARSALVDQLSSGAKPKVLEALAALVDMGTERDLVRERMAARQDWQEIFVRGPVGLAERDREGAVIGALRSAAEYFQTMPLDLDLIGALLWALDYFAGPSQSGEFQAVRDALLQPVRTKRPPPGTANDAWAEIPGGSFAMGSEGDQPGHEVRVSPFRMLVHPVTNAQFRRFVSNHAMNYEPTVPRVSGVRRVLRFLSGRSVGAGQIPLVNEELPANVSWYRAYAYAAWLGGRLPTEAEWEYASRAGCPHEYCDRDGNETTLDKVGWYDGNSDGRLHPVMRLEPNPWGLYDMYGNVWEWVADWHGEYPDGAQVDPWGPPSGENRVMRGGSYRFSARHARAANRNWFVPEFENDDVGFRVVLPGAPSQSMGDH